MLALCFDVFVADGIHGGLLGFELFVDALDVRHDAVLDGRQSGDEG